MRLGATRFTLVEMMIVVALIGVLAAIAIPSFNRARTGSWRNACINNLRQIDSAQRQAMFGVPGGAGPRLAGVRQYLSDPSPVCPATRMPYNLVRVPPVCPSGPSFADHVL